MKPEMIDWDGCVAIRFALKRDLKYWREAAKLRRLGAREKRLEFLEFALEIRALLKKIAGAKELQVTGRFA